METALFTLLVLGAVLAYLTTDDRPPTIEEPRRPGAKEAGGLDATSSPRLLGPLSGVSPVVGRRSVLVGALLALAAMTRPEGILVAGVCGLQLLITSWRAGQVAWRRLFGLALGFLAIFGPYYLWRFSYYGYPLPNTFYAKVGGTSAQALRGLGYAAEFARSQAPLIAVALIGIALAYLATTDDRPTTNDDRESSLLAGRRSSVVGRWSSFLWLLLIIYTLYIVAVGGDHFPFYRFFVPLLPPLALVAAVGFGQLGRALPRHATAPALALIAAAGVGWQIPQLYASRTLNADGRVWSENSVVEKNREIGLWLRAHTPPDTLIATGIAGALPFYAERPVLDTLGLNDLHIAHLDVPTIGQGVAGAEKTDNDYILRRAPAYVPYSSAGALLEDPRFLQLYDRGIVHGPEGRWLRLYKRADIAPPETWTPIEDQ
jgi:hypothetical protein